MAAAHDAHEHVNTGRYKRVLNTTEQTNDMIHREASLHPVIQAMSLLVWRLARGLIRRSVTSKPARQVPDRCGEKKETNR